MPFKSAKQRAFLFAEHPDIARRWANEEKMGSGTTRNFASMLNQKSATQGTGAPTSGGILKENNTRLPGLADNAQRTQSTPGPKPNLWAKLLKKGMG